HENKFCGKKSPVSAFPECFLRARHAESVRNFRHPPGSLGAVIKHEGSIGWIGFFTRIPAKTIRAR
ncbi:MAG TPA: hypothetical protein PKI05_04515, partial [Thermogutta sp.]|nr:hypothetical protein [Thermogutta sp.]